MADSYSSSDLQRVANVSRNAITSWTDAKLITADIADAAGTGKHRRFSYLNLMEAAAARELSSCGVTRHQLARWLPSVRQGVKKRSHFLYCLADGTVLFLRGKTDLSRACDKHESGHVINLHHLTRNIVKALGGGTESAFWDE